METLTQYWERARRCNELARLTPDPTIKAQMHKLAAEWVELAIKRETKAREPTGGPLSSIEPMSSRAPQSLRHVDLLKMHFALAINCISDALAP